MKAAIYCRVSTDAQELEGTSLNSQREACLLKAKELGYEVPLDMIILESFTGATLDRPGLANIRNWVKNKDIDAVIAFDPDRLARDFVLLMVLTNELEKEGIELIFVTQSVGKSPEDRMLFGMRGLFAEYERAKIRSRTLQGRKARAKQGGLSGGFHTTYGYDYQKANGKLGGRRVINEKEAYWIRQMFHWLVVEGLTTGAIVTKLIDGKASTKKGKPWSKASVVGILNNPCYCGQTYAFTKMDGKARQKPQNEWIEVKDATPAIISQDTFQAAKKQLQINRQKAKRNTHREYLLRGHVRCRQCGYAYSGDVTTKRCKDGIHYRRLYRCLGKEKESLIRRGTRCHNRIWGADKLESSIWAEVKGYLSKPEVILNHVQARKEDASRVQGYEIELEQIDRQLLSLDREQKDLLHNALRGFPESLIISENKKLNTERESLTKRKSELEVRIKNSKEAVINLPKLEEFIERIRTGITELDYEGKRLALDMLDIKVWLDGSDVEITGAIDLDRDVIVTAHS